MTARLPPDVAAALRAPRSKRLYNEIHFAAAAARYDLATRGMSLGRDGAWKRTMIGALPDLPEPFCVDLGCGTGDLAALLARRYPRGNIVGIDIAAPMLVRARERNREPNVRFEQGDMSATRFPTGSVDVVAGGYALRNAPDLAETLAEIRRILRPGGIAAFLDFAKPSNRLVQRAERWLLGGWCGLWGLLLHGNPRIHGYIAPSLARFPDRARLRELFAASGFEVTRSRAFFLGITELVVLCRLPGTA